MTKKDLLMYIKLYSGCDDYALTRINALIDKYVKANQVVRKEIVKQYIDRVIIKEKYDDELTLIPLPEYQKEFCTKNNISIDDLRSRNRSRNLVRLRRDYSISAHLKGYTFVEIGKSINRDHTTIVHYFYHYKI